MKRPSMPCVTRPRPHSAFCERRASFMQTEINNAVSRETSLVLGRCALGTEIASRCGVGFATPALSCGAGSRRRLRFVDPQASPTSLSHHDPGTAAFHVKHIPCLSPSEDDRARSPCHQASAEAARRRPGRWARNAGGEQAPAGARAPDVPCARHCSPGANHRYRRHIATCDRARGEVARLPHFARPEANRDTHRDQRPMARLTRMAAAGGTPRHASNDRRGRPGGGVVDPVLPRASIASLAHARCSRRTPRLPWRG